MIQFRYEPIAVRRAPTGYHPRRNSRGSVDCFFEKIASEWMRMLCGLGGSSPIGLRSQARRRRETVDPGPPRYPGIDSRASMILVYWTRSSGSLDHQNDDDHHGEHFGLVV